ncbi:hypothetical protein J3R30DRAFT_3589566 [Lentinula aciculospora]|uniref:Uncharacterized protein n=1 Tax=Lentinula aciculospora TaxID=153920 RepID=A0A9W9DEB5_9AGAR|nr:hypothetical protein J3R30DRAFT_3589566 [Lentinula aciculospora]
MDTHFISPMFPPFLLFVILYILLYPSTSFYHPSDLCIVFQILLLASHAVAYTSEHSYI